MKILFPISLILTSIIIFFFITNPFYKNVKELKNDVSIYNNALSSAKELQNKRDSLLEEYRNVRQEDKNRLNSFLPDTVNNIRFILEIERIANLHGMPLKNIKFESKDLPENQSEDQSNEMVASSDEMVLDPKSYGVFPIEFVTEGSYDSFLFFLKDLEYNLRLMDIKQVSFLVPDPILEKDSKVDPNIYNFMLKVDTYWLK